MSLNSEKILDATGWRLLQALQQDARLSFSELGRMVGLSPPAATERVRRMEEAGIITGYQAQVSPEKVGLPLMALIELTTSPEKYTQVIALIQDIPEVLECHHVTGNCSLAMKVVAISINHLEDLIGKLSQFGHTSTSIVLSSPIAPRGINCDG